MADGPRIGDQAGIGEWAKAVVKLLDVLQSGVGAIWAPHQLTRMARAEVESEKIRLEGRRELEELRALPPAPGDVVDAEFVEAAPLLLTRTKHRTEYQEAKRQLNVEDVARGAFENLKDCPDEQVSDDPVDEDWTARFFEYVKDVSNTDMQTLWSRILAGEVKRPGSFSLRCLETVRNLTSDEAHLFQSCLPFVVDKFVLRLSGFPEKKGIRIEEAVELADAGLFAADLQLSWSVQLKQKRRWHLLFGSDLGLTITPAKDVSFALEAYVLTGPGIELARMSPVAADRDFVAALAAFLRVHQCETQAFRMTRNPTNREQAAFHEPVALPGEEPKSLAPESPKPPSGTPA